MPPRRARAGAPRTPHAASRWRRGWPGEGGQLAVDQAVAPVGQPAAQLHEGHLGGIAGVGEHRFAAEHPAEGDAVQPADEFAVAAAFDRMGVTAVVQGGIGGAHGRCDPGAGGVRARPRAGGDDGFERGVERERESTVAQALGEAARDVHVGRREHGTRCRRPPQDRLAVGVPGEDAAAVGLEQARRAEVAANREEAVGVAQGMAGGRKIRGQAACPDPVQRAVQCRGIHARSLIAGPQVEA